MVRYLQASDLHGIENVQAVIDIAVDRPDLDAVFLNGDILDREEDTPVRYQWARVAQEKQQEFANSTEAQDLNDKINEIFESALTPQELEAFDLAQELEMKGGVQKLFQKFQAQKGKPEGETDRQLLLKYFQSQEQLKSADAKLQDHEDEIADLTAKQEELMWEGFYDVVRPEYQELDRECGRLQIGVFYTTGNHDDGELLDELENLVRLDTKTETIEIKGVRFAGAPNTREKIRGFPARFYQNTESMPSADSKTGIVKDPTTKQMMGYIDAFLEKNGDDTDVRDFRRSILKRSGVYNRLTGMEEIDVLMLHNPVGRDAYLTSQKNGTRDKTFIDYSYAVGEAIKELQPSVLGWGHMHGRGTYVADDDTFGYFPEGLHSTNKNFYIADVDEETKKLTRVEVWEIVDTSVGNEDPNLN